MESPNPLQEIPMKGSREGDEVEVNSEEERNNHSATTAEISTTERSSSTSDEEVIPKTPEVKVKEESSRKEVEEKEIGQNASSASGSRRKRDLHRRKSDPVSLKKMPRLDFESEDDLDFDQDQTDAKVKAFLQSKFLLQEDSEDEVEEDEDDGDPDFTPKGVNANKGQRNRSRSRSLSMSRSTPVTFGLQGQGQGQTQKRKRGRPCGSLGPKFQETPELFQIRWKDHQAHLLQAFEFLLENEAFCDVTLICDPDDPSGEEEEEIAVRLKAHKIVLSACSEYFRKILAENPCKHPIIVLKDYQKWEVQTLLDFMYRGEVDLRVERVEALVKAGESLQIRGLSESLGRSSTPFRFEGEGVKADRGERSGNGPDLDHNHRGHHPLYMPSSPVSSSLSKLGLGLNLNIPGLQVLNLSAPGERGESQSRGVGASLNLNGKGDVCLERRRDEMRISGSEMERYEDMGISIHDDNEGDSYGRRQMQIMPRRKQARPRRRSGDYLMPMSMSMPMPMPMAQDLRMSTPSDPDADHDPEEFLDELEDDSEESSLPLMNNINLNKLLSRRLLSEDPGQGDSGKEEEVERPETEESTAFLHENENDAHENFHEKESNLILNLRRSERVKQPEVSKREVLEREEGALDFSGHGQGHGGHGQGQGRRGRREKDRERDSRPMNANLNLNVNAIHPDLQQQHLAFLRNYNNWAMQGRGKLPKPSDFGDPEEKGFPPFPFLAGHHGQGQGQQGQGQGHGHTPFPLNLNGGSPSSHANNNNNNNNSKMSPISSPNLPLPPSFFLGSSMSITPLSREEVRSPYDEVKGHGGKHGMQGHPKDVGPEGGLKGQGQGGGKRSSPVQGWPGLPLGPPPIFGRHRAQHSAPRGGPPRAWSNADLTEALHNVWNKKMTTSQASRIFGIPYNSLLMYVRGKYGKSLKLDLLKKGLDQALENSQNQQQNQQGQQNSSPSSSKNSSSSSNQGSPSRGSASSRSPVPGTGNAANANSNANANANANVANLGNIGNANANVTALLNSLQQHHNNNNLKGPADPPNANANSNVSNANGLSGKKGHGQGPPNEMAGLPEHLPPGFNPFLFGDFGAGHFPFGSALQHLLPPHLGQVMGGQVGGGHGQGHGHWPFVPGLPPTGHGILNLKGEKVSVGEEDK